jgi:hypothetical protein
MMNEGDRNMDADRITHEMIAERAYARFVARGFVHGCDREDWLAAEAELRAERPVTTYPQEDDEPSMARKSVKRPPARPTTRANKTSKRR